MLARVHASDLSILARGGRRRDLAFSETVIDDCAHLLPNFNDRLEAVRESLLAALISRPDSPGLIHRDFSADQVLIGSGCPCLIDSDRSATSDRDSDIGSFLARLDEEVLDGTTAPDAAARAGDTLQHARRLRQRGRLKG
ncbi:aminoglycoside phosphotransferase family protein [Paracoccus sp. Z118]|nr:phosphotransferase [Paracoccus sp. Z118]MBV0891555.1 aminoglycoside phosphotransferase family protein [Paracoccus sp. Z118]